MTYFTDINRLNWGGWYENFIAQNPRLALSKEAKKMTSLAVPHPKKMLNEILIQEHLCDMFSLLIN